jgi:HemY protein
VRMETLASKTPGHLESALAVARAAIDAAEFARAREALAPFVSAPTQRVAMLMAEIERTEHGDSGRARAWTLRAVHARHDPVWTADGYVSDKWRPVSPVSGRLDAFKWQTPVAALPSDKSDAIEAKEFDREINEAISAPRRVEPPREVPGVVNAEVKPADDLPAEQDNSPINSPANSPAPAAASDPAPAPAPSPAPPPSPSQSEASNPTAAPMFRPRRDLRMPGTASVPPVIPILRPPDDPGIDEDGRDEFAERIAPSQGQAGGWRGFLSRWGG